MRSLGRGLVTLALAAMTFAAILAAPARAADMAVPPSYRPPAVALPPAMYNWTGIYVGGNVGAGLLSDSISPNSAAGTVAISGNQSARPFGLIGGGQLGANYQFDAWVVGIEGAWSASNLSGYGINSAGPAPITQERNTSNPLWLASVSGRVGYAANDWLLYAKGGGAWLRAQYIQDSLAGGTTVATGIINTNRQGFVAGGGIEYGLTENLSARLEYDFYDFGTKVLQFAATPLNNTSYLHTVTVGLNWRFTPQPSGQRYCPTC